VLQACSTSAYSWLQNKSNKFKRRLNLVGKINFLDVYRDRIKRIEIDISKAISEKKWNELAKFRAEKQRLENLIQKG
jgi:hypothetical protein